MLVAQAASVEAAISPNAILANLDIALTPGCKPPFANGFVPRPVPKVLRRSSVLRGRSPAFSLIQPTVYAAIISTGAFRGGSGRGGAVAAGGHGTDRWFPLALQAFGRELAVAHGAAFAGGCGSPHVHAVVHPFAKIRYRLRNYNGLRGRFRDNQQEHTAKDEGTHLIAKNDGERPRFRLVEASSAPSYPMLR